MTAPFEFVACLQLREMLGRTAWDERELLTGIEHVPADSIYYHTHSSFLRSRYPSAPYPNDFATWVATQVRDPVLGERLAVVDPFMFDDLELLRNAMLAILDDHLQAEEPAPRVGAVGRAGEPLRRVAYRPRRRPPPGRDTIRSPSALPNATRRNSASSASRRTGQSAPAVTARMWRTTSSGGTAPVFRWARASRA